MPHVTTPTSKAFTKTSKVQPRERRSTKRKGRPLPKKYVPVVKGLACERHALVDIAAFFKTTPEVIAGIVFGRDFADVRPLKLPRLPVLKFADIVDVSKWLTAAIKTLDKGETLEARGMILRAEEIVNSAR